MLYIGKNTVKLLTFDFLILRGRQKPAAKLCDSRTLSTAQNLTFRISLSCYVFRLRGFPKTDFGIYIYILQFLKNNYVHSNDSSNV